MDKLRRMEIFVAVAESRQFTRAANKLNLSKSAVTHAVSDLEAYLGVQLITRDNRNFDLTDAGQDYLEESTRILSDIGELEDTTRNIAHSISGQIRISAPITYGALVLAPIFGEFIRENPQVKLVLEYTDRVIDLTQEGGDLAIRMTDLYGDSSNAYKLSSMQMYICASPEFVKSHRIRTLTDLDHVACFRYTGSVDWRLIKDGETHSYIPKGQVESNSGEALRELAIAGSGVAFLPDFIAESALNEGKLVRVLKSYVGRTFDIYAVHPHNRHRSMRVRRLVEFLENALST